MTTVLLQHQRVLFDFFRLLLSEETSPSVFDCPDTLESPPTFHQLFGRTFPCGSEHPPPTAAAAISPWCPLSQVLYLFTVLVRVPQLNKTWLLLLLVLPCRLFSTRASPTHMFL